MPHFVFIRLQGLITYIYKIIIIPLTGGLANLIQEIHANRSYRIDYQCQKGFNIHYSFKGSSSLSTLHQMKETSPSVSLRVRTSQATHRQRLSRFTRHPCQSHSQVSGQRHAPDNRNVSISHVKMFP